jgi:multidrug resistance efflux pump
MFTGEIQRSRSKKPFVIGGALALLVVAVVLFLPFPRTVKSTFTLQGATSTEAKATCAGKVLEVVSASGKSVSSGDALLKLDASAAEKQAADAQAKLDALSKLKPANAKDAAKGQADVKKAEAAYEAAAKALEAAREKAKDKKTPALAKAEKKEKAAAAALDKAKAKARPGEEELKAQVAEAQKQLAAAKAEVDSCTIKAPAPGVVVGLRVAKGAEVQKNDVVALIASTAKLKAVVEEPANQKLRKGMALELVLDSGRKKLLFDDDAKDGKAVAEFDNAKGELQPGMGGPAEIAGDDTNLLSTLLGK